MGSSIWLIFILLMGAILGYLFLKSRGSIGETGELQSKLTNLISLKGENIIEELEAETSKEQKKAEELTKILDAKQKLRTVRVANAKLRKEIADVGKTVARKEVKL